MNLSTFLMLLFSILIKALLTYHERAGKPVNKAFVRSNIFVCLFTVYHAEQR